jgi:hypothetical protein
MNMLAVETVGAGLPATAQRNRRSLPAACA